MPHQSLDLTTPINLALHPLEKHLLAHQAEIESWFRREWQKVPLLFYGSVDLRNAGFKLTPVDTNLFPAGFNNLNPEFIPLCIQAVQSTIAHLCPNITKILLIPESHTGHSHYFEHLANLQEILIKAGFVTRIGSLLETLKTPKQIQLPSGKSITLEPLLRDAKQVYLENFVPCLILLNNDFSTGIPPILQGIEQKIAPPLNLGWATRSKAKHFQHYQVVSQNFAEAIKLDPWLIAPLFCYCSEVDFMKGEGMECLTSHVAGLLEAIQKKYDAYKITQPPFVVVKADSGTYGMAVMTVKNAEELRHLNRKQRQNMAKTKGGRPVGQVIIQEGVYSVETWGSQHSVAEPVVYMIGHHVVGGFYRVHAEKSNDENLNAPGMNFESLAFTEPCNNPCDLLDSYNNRFYVYGVIARLAMLAAAKEAAA